MPIKFNYKSTQVHFKWFEFDSKMIFHTVPWQKNQLLAHSHMYVQMNKHIYVYRCIYSIICVYIYIFIYLYICEYIYIYARIYPSLAPMYCKWCIVFTSVRDSFIPAFGTTGGRIQATSSTQAPDSSLVGNVFLFFKTCLINLTNKYMIFDKYWLNLIVDN